MTFGYVIDRVVHVGALVERFLIIGGHFSTGCRLDDTVQTSTFIVSAGCVLRTTIHGRIAHSNGQLIFLGNLGTPSKSLVHVLNLAANVLVVFRDMPVVIIQRLSRHGTLHPCIDCHLESLQNSKGQDASLQLMRTPTGMPLDLSPRTRSLSLRRSNPIGSIDPTDGIVPILIAQILSLARTFHVACCPWQGFGLCFIRRFRETGITIAPFTDICIGFFVEEFEQFERSTPHERNAVTAH
mmetsp:Transcript_25991/g.43360  ORF Transcript_25991/g.43360 Transcript_25991/m.43360 type:complete len:240 (+) Transcript_25991:1229-1948(+)